MNKLIRLLRNLLGITNVDSHPTDAQKVHSLPRFTAVSDVDGVVVVRFDDLNAAVRGCDMDKINNLAAELFTVVQRNPVAVFLDFEGKEYVPWAAFENVLVTLHKKLNDRLKMCNLPPMVAEQFKINQLDTLFHIYAGLDDALAAVKIPHLELPNGRRIPLIDDRVLVGRIPYDEEKHRNLLGITNDEARCEGEWLYLPDPYVSKRHAILTRTDEDKYAIEDTGHTGGTFVNDQAITERTTLDVGDTIKLGELNIVYSDEITRSLHSLWLRLDCD
jgi:hypothetical protein